MLAEGKKGDAIKAAANNSAGRIRGQIEGGDQLENIPELERKKAELLFERAIVEAQVVEEKKKLEDMKAKGMGRDRNFLSKNEFEKQEALIKNLEGQMVYNRNNPQNLENRIMMIDKRLQKFGTTNGLLYNLDELRNIMSDAELKDLIKMSVTQQGAQFLQTQKEATAIQSVISPIVINKGGNQTVNKAEQVNVVKKLSMESDANYHREAYGFAN
jgi:hypothetical protein